MESRRWNWCIWILFERARGHWIFKSSHDSAVSLLKSVSPTDFYATFLLCKVLIRNNTFARLCLSFCESWCAYCGFEVLFLWDYVFFRVSFISQFSECREMVTHCCIGPSGIRIFGVHQAIWFEMIATLFEELKCQYYFSCGEYTIVQFLTHMLFNIADQGSHEALWWGPEGLDAR